MVLDQTVVYMFQKTIAEIDNKDVSTQLIKSRFGFSTFRISNIIMSLCHIVMYVFDLHFLEVLIKICPGDPQKEGTGNKIPFDVWLINFTVVASIKKRTNTAIPIYSKQVLFLFTYKYCIFYIQVLVFFTYRYLSFLHTGTIFFTYSAPLFYNSTT